MNTEIVFLKSVCQYVDVKGNIYPMSTNGNIDNMEETVITHIGTAPQTWWNGLSGYDLKIADIIYGGLIEKEMYGKN
jgi:hypothetical protein